MGFLDQLGPQIDVVKKKLTELGTKIGLVKPGKPSVKTAGAKPGVKTSEKKFDFNMFIKAHQEFWPKFFKVSIPAFFKDPVSYFKKYPDWFNALSNDEKAAHVIVYTGSLFVLFGIVFMIVL